MLATTTANATTDYAEVTARAKIEVANSVECTDLDWGTIVVKQNNQEFTLDAYDPSKSQTEVISYDNNKGESSCSGIGGNGSYNLPDSLTLTSDNGGNPLTLHLYRDSFEDGFFLLGSSLTVPANVKTGNYEAHFTVSFTY